MSHEQQEKQKAGYIGYIFYMDLRLESLDMYVLSELLTEVRKLVNGHGGEGISQSIGDTLQWQRKEIIVNRKVIGWEVLNRVGDRWTGKRTMDRDKNTNDFLRK